MIIVVFSGYKHKPFKKMMSILLGKKDRENSTISMEITAPSRFLLSSKRQPLTAN